MKSRLSPSSSLVLVASTTISAAGRAVFVQSSFSPPLLSHSYSNSKKLPLMTTTPSTQAARRSAAATTLKDSTSGSGSSVDATVDHHHHHRYFILRHGETDANASGQIQGSSDISRLTDLGRKQAAQAAVSGLNRLPIDMMHQVYVSPLTRAQETLSILRQHVQPGRLPAQEIVMHELHEIDLYEWEGRHKTDLKVNDPVAYEAWTTGDAHGFEVSGRKPILETWDRADKIWKKLRRRSSQSQSQQQQQQQTTSSSGQSRQQTTTNANSNTLLVCHGTLGQALLCAALQWDPTYFRKHEFPNCGMVEILWRPDHHVATGFRWHHPEPSDLLVPEN